MHVCKYHLVTDSFSGLSSKILVSSTRQQAKANAQTARASHATGTDVPFAGDKIDIC